MPHQSILVAIVGFGLLNGLFSPIMLAFSYPLALVLAQGFLVSGVLGLVLFLTSLIAATLTIMLAGIPAALYERLTRSGQSTAISLWIWLVTTAVLSFPALIIALGHLRSA